MRSVPVLCCSALLAVVACSSGGEPMLSISARPSQVGNAGETTTLSVYATNESGLAGKGEVRIYSAAGSLKDGETWPLDPRGAAETGFSCDARVDPACINLVRVFAEWVTGGKTVTADRRLTLEVAGAGGGAGGGSGAGLPAHPAWLLGTLVEGLVGREAFAPLTAPRPPWIGFPSGSSMSNALITKPGELIYPSLSGVTPVWRRWRVDTGRSGTSGWEYPDAPEANDVAIAAPSGCSKIDQIHAWPDTGELVFECPMFTYFDGSGALDVGAGTRRLALPGFNRTMLIATVGSWFVRSAGVDTPVIGVPGVGFTDMRATPNGFWMIEGEAPVCRLHLIAFDGTVSMVGDYAPLPASRTPVNGDGCVSAARRWRAVDAAGDLYVWVTGTGTGISDAIAVRKLMPGTSSIVYDEGTLPMTDFMSQPPVLPVKMHDFSLLAP